MPKIIFFIALALLVTFNQIVMLKPVLDRGIMPEDWDMLLGYKIEQQRLPFLTDRIKDIWKTQEKLYKNQIIYIGIFNDIFGLNRTAYILTNIALKIGAALSIYLLIITLFKNRLLGFAASFFFSVSPSASASLTYIVTGDDYLSIIFMSFFGISYFNLISKGQGLLRASLFLLLSVLSSPIRMHPFIIVPLFIESLILVKNFLPGALASVTRLIFFLSPVYFLYFKLFGGDFKVWDTAVGIIKQISQNNWHTLLPPLFSLGFTIADNDMLNILLWSSDANTITLFLLGKLALVFLFPAILITWLVNPKNKLRFFTAVYLPANILNVLIYLSIQNINNIPLPLRAPYNPSNFLAAFTGGYYLILGTVIFFEWFLHRRKDKLLLLLPASVFWTALFTTFTWLEVGSGISYGNPVHRYLTIPSIGTSLFAAALLVMFFNRSKSLKSIGLRYTLICLTVGILILIYFYQTSFVKNYYDNENKFKGRSGIRQEMLKQRFDQALGKTDPKQPALIYIELGKKKKILADYENTFFNPTVHTVFYSPDETVIYSCRTFIFPDYSQVLKIAVFKDAEIQFTRDSRCAGPDGRYAELITYKADDFYAYLLEDDNFSNIKDAVLDKLRTDLK